MSSHDQVIDILTVARDRVAHGWCQHTSNDAEGNVCAGNAIARARQSVLGDWDACIGPVRERKVAIWTRATHFFMDAVRELWPDHQYCDIPAWNDDPERTQEEVLDAFDRALKMAERDRLQNRASRRISDSWGLCHP